MQTSAAWKQLAVLAGDVYAPPAPPRLRDLEAAALAATRAAALACQDWVGRGDPIAADGAATEAMRVSLTGAPGSGTVVIGEGAKDEAPMLFQGERVGAGGEPAFDIAVDPLECTKLCARGLPGSLATIAFAEAGSMASLGPAFYMDKLVGPPGTRGAIDIADPPERTVDRLGETLDKAVGDLVVVVLDKPRHEELIRRLRRAGARVTSPPDGDVAGALSALLPGGGADLLWGVGGTPEGVMTACAARALGGFMQGRLAPQRADEERAVTAAGLSVERVYELEDLVGGESFFAATGVTGGSLLRRPWDQASTESLLVAEGRVRRIVEAASGAARTGHHSTTTEAS
jgi:fructose-1,6-bisphosphatase II